MQHVLENGKRALSVAVAAATIMFSVGASLLTPSQAKAASAGDLIKGTSLTTVYYYGHDGARYVFPNEKTFMSWYSDFNDVTTISDSALADIELGGNVAYRPGSQWIKVTSDPDVYAVGVDGTIHLIEEPETAEALAGSDWASRIHDVPDVFFPDYSVGLPLSEAEVFDGALYMDGGSYYLALDGEKHEISSAGRSANNLESSFFLDGASIDDSSLTEGSDITGEWNVLVDAAQTVTADDAGATTGDLTISEASSNPASASVADLAVGVEMLSFDVEAGDEDGTLNSVTLTMTGLADANELGNVYLYEGVTRLTDARSVNSSTRQVTFGSLGLDVDAGDTRTITVRADIHADADTSDQFSFEISSDDDVDASGSVGGSFPVEGGTFTVATVSVGTATVTKYGTISNPTIGEDDAVIGQFKIAAASEDASVEAVTLKVDDSDDHSDFWLWVDGDAIAEGTDIGDNLVEFDLSADPIMIEEGQNEIFSVSADIGGENGDDVKVYIENSADLIVVGGDYGFGMAITRTTFDGDSCTTTGGDCSFSDVEGGDITLVFNGPTAQDIRVDSQDQTLLEFSLTSAQEVTIKDLDIIVYADDDASANDASLNDATDATEEGNDDDDQGLINGDDNGVADSNDAASVTDIKIVNVDTGAVVMGPMELDSAAVGGNDAAQTIDFTDDFTVEAGETLNLAVTVDIDDAAASGTEFAAAIDLTTAGAFVARDANDDSVTNIIPSGNITGYNMEATSASVTFALASSPVASTVVQGKQGVEVLGVSVTAADASDINVTSLTFTGYADDTDTDDMTAGGAANAQLEDLVSSCSLYDADDTLLDGPVAPAASTGKVVFNDMDWTVAAGSVELLTLVCNLSNPSQTDVDPIAFDLLADSASVTTSTEVTAVDEEGDDATVVISKPGAANTLGLNDSTADTQQDPTVYMNVDDAGTVTAAASSGTPSADFVLTGSSSNYVGEFTFTSTLEDAVIDKLTITEESAADFTGTATSSIHSNNISLVTITYPSTDGTTKSASAVMTGKEATFSGLTFDAAVGVQNNVKVYVNVPSSDRNSGGSAQSNEMIEIGLSADSGDFNAVGADSGTTDTALTAVETDRRFVVRETKPTVSLSSSSPSGSKTPGNQEVIRLNVAAGSNENIVFSEIVFAVSASDNNGEGITDGSPDWNECENDAGTSGFDSTDFDFYNLSEDGTSSPLTATYSFMTSALAACTGTQSDVAFVSMVLGTAEVVPAGQTYVYSLWFDSSSASAVNDDTIQFSLPVDPIASTFLASSTVNAGTTTATTTDITVTDSSGYSVGDVICINLDATGCDSTDERAYVAAVLDGTSLLVTRGYLGTTPVAFASSDRIERMPSSFVWYDNGSSLVSTTDGNEEVWGSYLVDSLTVTGNTLAF